MDMVSLNIYFGFIVMILADRDGMGGLFHKE